MRNLLAGTAVLVVACVTGCFGIPSAVADDPQVPGPPIPGIAPDGTVKAAPQRRIAPRTRSAALTCSVSPMTSTSG